MERTTLRYLVVSKVDKDENRTMECFWNIRKAIRRGREIDRRPITIIVDQITNKKICTAGQLTIW